MFHIFGVQFNVLYPDLLPVATECKHQARIMWEERSFQAIDLPDVEMLLYLSP